MEDHETCRKKTTTQQFSTQLQKPNVALIKIQKGTSMSDQNKTSCFFSSLRASVIFIFTAYTVTVSTASTAASGSLSFQTSFDSGDSTSNFIDLSVSVNKKTRLFLGTGNTSSNESSPGANDALDLDYNNIGISHQFTDTFKSGLNGSTIEQGQDISSRTLDLSMTWTGEQWSFLLRPQFRKLELLFTPTRGPQRIIDINSTGIGTSLGYLGKKNWEFFVTYNKYKYDRNVRRLNIPFVINRISASALTIASSVKDYGMRIDVTRLYAESDITASYGQSKSAVDGSLLNISNLSANFYQFDPVAIGVTIGIIDSGLDDASYYGSLNLSYAW